MLRRSERLAYKRDKESKILLATFQHQITLFKETPGKKKLLYYENICRLFIAENNYFKYDKCNLRQETKYDTIMRDVLISAKFNKNQLEEGTVFELMKKEKTRILYYIQRTIHFIEKYLNKKTELLKKTVLNDDVIREIITFL
jgi:hypothetical protein